MLKFVMLSGDEVEVDVRRLVHQKLVAEWNGLEKVTLRSEAEAQASPGVGREAAAEILVQSGTPLSCSELEGNVVLSGESTMYLNELKRALARVTGTTQTLKTRKIYSGEEPAVEAVAPGRIEIVVGGELLNSLSELRPKDAPKRQRTEQDVVSLRQLIPDAFTYQGDGDSATAATEGEQQKEVVEWWARDYDMPSVVVNNELPVVDIESSGGAATLEDLAGKEYGAGEEDDDFFDRFHNFTDDDFFDRRRVF